MRRWLSRLFRRRRAPLRVITTSDPAEYARLANRFVYYPFGLETEGPRRIAEPAWTEIHLRFEYEPPKGDALAAAVTPTAGTLGR